MEPSKINFERMGENIRKQREAKGIKQEWLAMKVNLDKSEISRIENGKRNTSVKMLLLIATVLEMDPSQLFL